MSESAGSIGQSWAPGGRIEIRFVCARHSGRGADLLRHDPDTQERERHSPRARKYDAWAWAQSHLRSKRNNLCFHFSPMINDPFRTHKKPPRWTRCPELAPLRRGDHEVRGSDYWPLTDALAMARAAAVDSSLAPLEVDPTRPGFPQNCHAIRGRFKASRSNRDYSYARRTERSNSECR